MADDGSLSRVVDPTRVALCGFSAGGHLASLLATQPDLDTGAGHLDELSDLYSSRPDRVILCYPVISFLDGCAAYFLCTSFVVINMCLSAYDWRSCFESTFKMHF